MAGKTTRAIFLKPPMRMGIEQFDYVGHSMGAFIGMTAASLDRGKHIRRLVLIDGLGRALADGAGRNHRRPCARVKGTFATRGRVCRGRAFETGLASSVERFLGAALPLRS